MATIHSKCVIWTACSISLGNPRSLTKHIWFYCVDISNWKSMWVASIYLCISTMHDLPVRDIHFGVLTLLPIIIVSENLPHKINSNSTVVRGNLLSLPLLSHEVWTLSQMECEKKAAAELASLKLKKYLHLSVELWQSEQGRSQQQHQMRTKCQYLSGLLVWENCRESESIKTV